MNKHIVFHSLNDICSETLFQVVRYEYVVVWGALEWRDNPCSGELVKVKLVDLLVKTGFHSVLVFLGNFVTPGLVKVNPVGESLWVYRNEKTLWIPVVWMKRS